MSTPERVRSNSVILGRFGRPSGLKGGIRLFVFSDHPESILTYSKLMLGGLEPEEEDSKTTEIKLELVRTNHKKNNKGFLVVSSTNYPSLEAVESIKNHFLLLPKNALPSLEKGFYFHELEGMEVFDQNDESLGKITSLFHNTSTPVMRILKEKKELLIPFIEETFVHSVDKEKGLVRVFWEPV